VDGPPPRQGRNWSAPERFTPFYNGAMGEREHIFGEQGGETILVCPFCVRDGEPGIHVHLEGADVEQGHSHTTVERDRSATVENRGEPVGRGSVVVVRCWCESGHRLAMHFGFHKGQTFFTVARGEDFTLDEEPGELWRR
jgi:hypothetical protein